MHLAPARPRPHRRLLLPAFLAACLAAGTAGAAGHAIAGSSEGTGEKPQSKLWYNDGTWWAIIKLEGHGLHFYEFDGADWRPCRFVDAALGAGGAADVKWNGERLFVLAYSSNPQLFEYTYDRALRVFELVSGFPVRLDIATGSETMVLDQDSTGRLWATYEGGHGDVYVMHSTSSDHRTWDAPGQTIHTGIKDDDISTLVAFDGRIGVFWSDQVRWRFGFRVHVDSDAPETWQPFEIVESGSGCSDDHLNLKADGQGNLYAVTKDLQNKMSLHVRSVTTGKWKNKSGVIPSTGTRAIVMVSDADRTLYVPFTNWAGSSLDIVLRKASTGTLSFSTAASPLIGGPTLNNCTGTKQVLPHGCFMAMAEGGGRTWWAGWGELPPDGPQPPPPPLDLGTEIGAGPPGGAGDRPPLVLDLPFDEGAGATTTDAASGGTVQLAAATGKTTLPAWVEGRAGAALHFDGQSALARMASTAALRIAGSFTTEAWVHWDGSATSGTILAKGKSGRRNYQVIVRADGRIDFRWETSGGTRHGLVGTHTLQPGSWQHVACVYDVEMLRSSIWLGGHLDAAVGDHGTPMTSDDPLMLGMRQSSTSGTDWLAGALDGVRVWQGVRYREEFDPEARDGSFDYAPRPGVVLSWSPPEAAAPLTYRVYRRVEGGPRRRLATDLAATRFVDESPVSGTLCYEVSAVDSLFREGRPAAACLQWSLDAPPPDLSKAALAGSPLPALYAAPNPFNPSTSLFLRMPATGWARLAVYDATGRRVALLHEGSLTAGPHHFQWAATGPQGHLHSGVYFARLDLAGQSLHHKLVLVQ